MTMIDRRTLLRGAGLMACSAAAHPFLTTVTLAGSDGGNPFGDKRLVIIILRGAMDGLDVVQPRGDADFARLRPTLSQGEALDLDGFFALNAGLGGLMPLWQAGQLGFVQAVATPYRDGRSHFTGQDLLEAGTGQDVPLQSFRDGWLNRMLQAVPGVRAETAYAVGRDEMKVLAGPAAYRAWAPETDLDLSPQARLLLDHVYHDDALFRDSAAEAMELALDEGMSMDGMRPQKGRGLGPVVDFVADRLLEESRIAAFSVTGWDTHRGQSKVLPRTLQGLADGILRLRERLGPQVWDQTAVLAMTEFGRTAAENGSAGTDHGTGGAMLAAGGAVRGGKVWGAWPGLSETALFERRDLMPTSDVRLWAASAMQGLYGLDRHVLEAAVFPGLQMTDTPGLILRA
jgi:uncharacterized protein (DUF1501 family)